MKGENRNHLQLLEIQFLLVELGLALSLVCRYENDQSLFLYKLRRIISNMM